eukprot:3308523-Rhodomonas_salina.1
MATVEQSPPQPDPAAGGAALASAEAGLGKSQSAGGSGAAEDDVGSALSGALQSGMPQPVPMVPSSGVANVKSDTAGDAQRGAGEGMQLLRFAGGLREVLMTAGGVCCVLQLRRAEAPPSKSRRAPRLFLQPPGSCKKSATMRRTASHQVGTFFNDLNRPFSSTAADLRGVLTLPSQGLVFLWRGWRRTL